MNIMNSFPKSKIIPFQLEGWGTAYRVELGSASEDGIQQEYVFEQVMTESSANLICETWRNNSHMVHLFSGIKRATEPNQLQPCRIKIDEDWWYYDSLSEASYACDEYNWDKSTIQMLSPQ